MSSKQEGFFMNFHETIGKSIDDVIFNNFANLECDSKRVAYVCGLPAIKNYDLTGELEKNKNGASFPVSKNVELARKQKAEGNAAVQKGDWVKALKLYNDSLVNMPGSEAEETSIVVANRSAALYHLQQWEASLADIARCLPLGYPVRLRYKVVERRARCLLALKRHDEAVQAFRETISALDDAQLITEKKQKMQMDAQLMTALMKKGQQLAKGAPEPTTSPAANTPPQPRLTGKPNNNYPAASDAIEFAFDESHGRYARAARPVSAGEVVLVERPYSGVLLTEFCSTHCTHCFTKCSIPVACPRCPNVIFCSDKCLADAQRYHDYECPILPLLWRSGCSVTCLVALRIITQTDLRQFIEIRPRLAEKPSGVYRSDDYANIYNLVAHEDKRTKKDLLHRTQMAVFLVKLIELSGYFNGKPRETPIKLEEIKTMSPSDTSKEIVESIGGLVMKNLQILQFNAHEVFELQCAPPPPGGNVIKHEGTSVFVAGAVFTTLALFNHSCEPGVVRYFNGRNIVVRAVKNINKGEEVAENYGPIFTTVPRAQRRAALKEQYWFDCECPPCQQNWPLYTDMKENYMRFKCDSDRPCSNVVAVPSDCKEFMVQCGLCQQYTNILKGLKALQDTDGMLRVVKAGMASGAYGEALKKLVQVLKLYDATLAPPYCSYYDCVQSLRRCMLALGNYSIKA